MPNETLASGIAPARYIRRISGEIRWPRGSSPIPLGLELLVVSSIGNLYYLEGPEDTYVLDSADLVEGNFEFTTRPRASRTLSDAAYARLSLWLNGLAIDVYVGQELLRTDELMSPLRPIPPGIKLTVTAIVELEYIQLTATDGTVYHARPSQMTTKFFTVIPAP